jgi:hypothetical protein
MNFTDGDTTTASAAPTVQHGADAAVPCDTGRATEDVEVTR